MDARNKFSPTQDCTELEMVGEHREYAVGPINHDGYATLVHVRENEAYIVGEERMIGGPQTYYQIRYSLTASLIVQGFSRKESGGLQLIDAGSNYREYMVGPANENGFLSLVHSNGSSSAIVGEYNRRTREKSYYSVQHSIPTY